MQLTQLFDVLDEVGRGVDAQVRIRIAGPRAATPTAALIEQNDSKLFGIEEASGAWATASAGTAMKKECGPASGLTAALPINGLPVAHIQHPRGVGLNGRKP
jgi:hypothetical protein